MVNIDLSTVVRDGHAVVGLRGELDLSDAGSVTAALADVVAYCPDVIINLADLEFIDCSSLWTLVAAGEQARRAGGALLLAAPQQLVIRVLALTGLADVFSVHASVEQAELAYTRHRPV
jgi:anti-sigma B factor antagonist